MGYFAAMTRQTGIVFRGAPITPARATTGIELSESRTAEPLAAPRNSAEPAPLAQSRTSVYAMPETPVRPTEIVATRVWEEPHLLSRPTPTVEQRDAATSIREFTLDAETATPVGNSKRDQKGLVQTLSAAGPTPQPSPGKAGDQRETSRDELRPTMADVLAWVAEPLKQISERQALEAVPLRPPPAPEIHARERVEPSGEVHTLEIGTIEIVMDAPPPVSPSSRSQTVAPTEQSGTQWNRASRHYLRF
jgi:hypothetical protein